MNIHEYQAKELLATFGDEVFAIHQAAERDGQLRSSLEPHGQSLFDIGP